MTTGVIILIAIILARLTMILFKTISPIIGAPLEWLGINATLLLIAATSALLYLQMTYSYRSSFSSFCDCVMTGTLGIIMVLLITWAISGLNSIAEVAAIIYLCALGAAMIEINPIYPSFFEPITRPEPVEGLLVGKS